MQRDARPHYLKVRSSPGVPSRLKAALVKFALIVILTLGFIVAGLCAVDLAVYLT